MRLRNKPWANDKLAENPEIVISDPANYRGKWKEEIFQNNKPIHLEIGTGRGSFIKGMAEQNPSINFVSVEKFTSVIVDALDLLLNTSPKNVRLLNKDAENLTEYFNNGEISRLYLNFSDPWPKNRHEKRRLSYKDFLDLYKGILVENGEIHLKTDNQALFEYSLESFSRYGLLVKNISLDLHKSEFEYNVMTEYEEKFSKKGNRIYRVEAQYR